MRGLYKILLLFLLACQDQNVLGSKIIKGKIADDTLMKYMVSVQEDGEHICGGFLVSKHVVVTHGGCKFDEKGKIFVVLGTHNLTQPGSKIKEQIKSTRKPPPGIGTDIMLIEIYRTKPEDLPEEIQLQDPETDVKENEKCQLAGWGPVENDGSDYDDKLHVVNVTVISPKACKVQIPGLRANAICTGGKQTTDEGGFCKSDAGGPLVCKGKAVGIATVDDKCSFPGSPNVYIDISKYRSWIDKVLNADGSIIPKAIAPDDTYEFLVSLQKNEKHVCGGFLIREDFVLTAAQCSAVVPDRVVVGTHNLLNVGDENVRYIEKSYKHESYTQVAGGYDIMLLKLTRKVAGNKKQIIALPPSNMHIQEKKICHVAGWGKTETGGGVVDRLMEVDVSVINLNTCSQSWGPSFPSDVICAGGYGSHKGFCQGDGGGPLVCDGIAVGVVSYNYDRNCDYPNKPNVYTEISQYLGWINSIIN
ncbi:plasminogen-like [Trematomus bernacchii]|uniref:plasminogen-like n=1 Tax=Trematomus bernacchii TaxID=40690 RepID=UPI00146F3B8F|nr:plasminogen-like [Trematomus bernacchii]